MSRSRKKAILKDKPRNRNKASLYWRRIRSTIKTKIRSCRNIEDLEIPNHKSIINDYEYCDKTIDYEYDRSSSYFWYNGKKNTEEHKKNVEKNRRK